MQDNAKLMDYLCQLKSLVKNGRIQAGNRDKYDKLIKQIKPLCSAELYNNLMNAFQEEVGWLFVGLDYASLEERINTLLTKDPNKIKVYTDGFDGHSFRAVSYWPDQFHDIDPTDPIQVNAIAKTEHGSKLRQKSKGPTFAF